MPLVSVLRHFVTIDGNDMNQVPRGVESHPKRQVPRGAKRRVRRDPTAGSATVQTVFAMPVIGLLIFGTFAFVLYFHAQQIAHLAASQGLEAARVQGGTQAAGQAAAEHYLAEFDKSTLHHGRVTVQRGNREVRVEVSGYAEQIVPFLNLPVHVTVTAPTETIGNGM